VVPTFTAATTSGWTASSSFDNAAYPPWRIFDKSTATDGRPNSASPTWTVFLTAPNTILLTGYAISASASNLTGLPSAWTFQGSNDGSTWTTLDTRSAVPAWVANEVKTFSVSNPQRFSQHRWAFTATQGGSGQIIPEITLIGAGAVAALQATSATFTAATVPSTAMITVLARAETAITLNTDLKAYVSRDGGTTWTQAVLSAGATVSGMTTYEATSVSLTAQPSGAAMKYRIETTAAVGIDVTGVALQWRS
jgi:hypothetical protein